MPTPTQMALVACGLLAAATAHAVSPRVNDTGVVNCIDQATSRVSSDCALSRQDAAYGRDATRDRPADGRHGFSFTKVAADGTALPADATEWACVRDNVTGRLWELKTATGLHAQEATYTNLGNGAPSDASGLAAATNAEALCGQSDWRLPTRSELIGLTDYSVQVQDSIDTTYFPHFRHANEGYYWSSTLAPNGVNIWTVGRRGNDHPTAEWTGSMDNEVQLVSYTLKPLAQPRFALVDDGVLDRVNKLVWQQCARGQVWDGSTCAGAAAPMKWFQALDVAQKLATQTGKGWRLPNVKELLSLTEGDSVTPQVDDTVFPNFPTNAFWSSTLRAMLVGSTAQDVLAVVSQTGATFPGRLFNGQYAVRLVRDVK